jgi:zinc transporter, ZIP family
LSSSQIVLLGAIAGFTIFLGLPLGRIRAPMPRLKVFLNALAIGILIFLLWDVLTHAWEPADTALGAHDWGKAFVYGLTMLGCLGISLMSLVYFDRWMKRRAAAMRPEGPGAAVAHKPVLPSGPDAVKARAVELSLLIAVGIGLHNFGEGLAIGSSATAGEISLALLLVIGFGLHNATEGFGIVAPLAAAGVRPTWGRLILLGLIGGGPTFVGTMVGQAVTNPLLGVAFLALAAGSILYVVIELLAVARASKLKELVTWAILLGIVLGFVTDAIVTAAGA